MTTGPLLAVRGLGVSFAGRPVVRDVSFTAGRGEVLAIVGESGSGKTVTALSLLGLLPGNAEVTGSALLDGTDLFTVSPARRRAIRGKDVAMVFQEPMSALNPVFTCGYQVREALRTARFARARTLELLELAGLSDPARIARSYPHELSGGQLQRVVIAMAIANDPALLIADEPTTALDVTVQAEVLGLLRDLKARIGMSLLLITHDMGVVADLADRVVVMRDGRIVEQNDVTTLFAAPSAGYTRELLGAVAAAPPSKKPTPQAAPVVRLIGATATYRGRFRSPPVRAVDDVSLEVGAGEVLGLVGESGSGKSTLAALITGLLSPAAGRVELLGTDLATLSRPALRAARRRIGVVFQDPASTLNPRNTVGAGVAEPIELHRVLSGPALTARVCELLEAVELPAAFRSRYPHELSGGQRQRVALARALALDPELLIADEPTSALDVSVQAKILALFHRLQDERGFAAVFISHDLSVIQRVADRVAVMLHGRVVELGPAADVLTAPAHSYTKRLLAAAPVADPAEQRRRRAAWTALRA
ncbi:dipeptide ABC transporter ATP-binding protein [Dactylosporangium matsuzakiense]|uniref:Oligopeptide ABC transporter, ATP-binding protein n=1 Tax=Dactylosporangium matsuzakiense TaxID=53360 RepID=A0A9W6KP60_9ACTN|nr:ABC transporter ATP-binding protein [Dactylosporangium matsuzakiense]UWZ42848.1 ABC transporter ATP-binding protein [Dactylosporangium matsuzakiense]GLL04717.1 putative oligopeptide ABC transporter, ATP-binding protein [Dactylosporangium matsuzakiense]